MPPLHPDVVGAADPFAGQENDPFLPNPLVLLCFLIGQLYPPALNWMGYFPPHNYRQWHVLEEALTAGWNNGAIKKGVVPAIPGCPKMWFDVSHYWNFGGILGILAYELVAYIRVVLVIAGIILAAHWNVLTPQKALTIILQQFGVVLPS